MNKVAQIATHVSMPTDGGREQISFEDPYVAHVKLRGMADLIFHRWNCESVDTKAKAAKNSKAKKTDDIESYVWRDQHRQLCVPGEYVRQSIIHAAKFKQDPRSPRKSAMDLFKAGIVSLTDLAPLGVTDWDYLDTRRVTVQRAGINRIRPAMRSGWEAEFVLQVLTPEYISKELLADVLNTAGRLIGVGDFRPTYGRFTIARLEFSQN